ncbi:MAG: multidrug efflux MFS transporter [Lactobacillales bacterium]|jgi:EmrB/QacA subfamily drug resistance transporter|nr:multidrug efflux MFS transporter [Lactobacillales bacterium]
MEFVQKEELKKKAMSILIILVIGTFLGTLNQTLMNTAMPTIMEEFKIDATDGQWITNVYMLMNAIMVPLTAYLIQRFSTRTLYLWSVGMFAIGTLFCGFAPTFSMLIVGRMIQAMGAGVLMPLMNVVVMNLFDIDKRGRAMGIIGLALNFAPAFGPTLSGLIVSYMSWRYLFLLIAPFIIIDFIVAFFILKNIGKTQKLKLDVLGVILSSVGLGSLLYGFSNAGGGDLASFKVWGFILIGLVVLVAFIFQQTHEEKPLLNFKVFEYKTFNITSIITVVLMMAMYGGALLLPLFLQSIQHKSAIISGLVMLPGALITAFLSPTAGRLYDKYGAKYLSLIGTIVLAIGTAMMIFFKLDTSVWYVLTCQFIRQLGLVLILMPIQTEALNAIPLSLIPDASAMYTTVRQIAGSFGTAAMITVMSMASKEEVKALIGHHAPALIAQLAQLKGIQVTYAATTAVTIVAALLCLTLSNQPHLFELKEND